MFNFIKKGKNFSVTNEIVLFIALAMMFLLTLICIAKGGNYINFNNQNLHRLYHYKELPLETLKELDALDHNKLAQGKETMSQLKIVFVGISRDNSFELPMVMRTIEHIGSYFKDYNVLVVENDSSDLTKASLGYWKIMNNRVQVISKDFFLRKRPSILFLAQMRNIYLQELASNPQYQDADIIAVMDMDMMYGIDERGVFDTFSQIERWDAVASLGVDSPENLNWDLFAFRVEGCNYSPSEYGLQRYWNLEHIASIRKTYPIEGGLVPVFSSFGGLAFYKRAAIQGCYYDSKEEDCEHVAFHRCILEQHEGRLYMNPAQLLRYSHYSSK